MTPPSSEQVTPPEHWRLIEESYHAALEREGEQREAFLKSLAREHPAVSLEVKSLLEVHSRSGSLLEESALAYLGDEGLALAPALLDGESMVGRIIGNYRIVRLIDRGGMGSVYLADRHLGDFPQQVAIKVIRGGWGGLDRRTILERFLAERRVLARLSHPNIARLLDGGSTDDGLPYVVMEYIEGKRIDDYCDEQRLTIRERLGLFTAVCAAVQHAHQNLVIHRDLKPGNILVTPEGAVKLLDFGIAKVLSGDDEPPGHDHTVTTERRLTPAYASPEQIKGADVTTASDVYALGVILYELLTGRRPYRLDTGGTISARDLEQAVCERAPTRPRHAVFEPAPAGAAPRAEPGTRAGEHTTAEAIAQSRCTDSKRLASALSGDIETILLTALDKEPERRYASAAALADDIRRYLSEQPIQARPPSALYQARKFAQRNRPLVFGAGAVLLGLVLAAAGTTLGMFRAEAAAREARIQQTTAEEVNAFLTDMLTSVSPENARGRDTTLLREILARAERRLDTELGNQPAVASTLHRAIGVSYHGLGLYPESRAHLQRALELSIRALGPRHPKTLACTIALVSTLTDDGQYSESEAHAERALNLSRTLYGEQHRNTILCINNLALVYRYQNRLDEAEPLYRRALELAESALPDADPLLPSLLNNLAGILRARSGFAEAEALLVRALEIRRDTLPPDHPDIALSLMSLASVRTARGEFAGAIRLFEEAIEIRRRTLGEKHDGVATTLLSLAAALNATGEIDRAIAATREAAEIYRHSLSPDHPWMGKALSNLSVMLSRKGDLDEAERLQREALALRRRAFAGDHADIALSLNSLGGILAQRGDYHEALRLYTEALDMRRRLFGETHTHIAYTLHDLGGLHHKLNNLPEARSSYEQSLAMRRRLLGDNNVLVAASLSGLGEVQFDLGAHEEAAPLFEQAVSIQRERLGGRHPAVANSLHGLGLCLLERGDAEAAKEHLLEAIDIAGSAPSAAPGAAGMYTTSLGVCLSAMGDDSEAEARLLDGLAAMERALGPDHPMLRRPLKRIAEFYESRGDAPAATGYRERLRLLR